MTKTEALRIRTAVRQAAGMIELCEVIDANVACCVDTQGNQDDYEDNIRATLGNKVTDDNFCDYASYLMAAWVLAAN